jgi:hypothetical protein
MKRERISQSTKHVYKRKAELARQRRRVNNQFATSAEAKAAAVAKAAAEAQAAGRYEG